MYKSILKEYGVPWVVNRSKYSLKLKLMNIFPVTENFFERKVQINKIDIFKIDTNNEEKFLKNISCEHKKEIIEQANKAMNGIIKAFSSIELNYGCPSNWHINPITNVETPKNIKWYKIPDFDLKRGDVKVVWEISRFTHFFYFSRAYMITKNQKYYEAFSNQLDEWIYNNPYSYGVNYKCGQEASLRMLSILINYSVFNNYGLTTERDKINVKKIVESSYKKIISNFFYAHKCIKNNHTLSEITGLIVGAWCSDNNKALKKAYDLLDKEIENQFMEDGGYIQFSFNYQRFVFQLMEFILSISSSTGLSLSLKSKDLLEKSVSMMYQLQDEKGYMPNYGSNDGALIFPITTCDYRDFRAVLNTLNVLLKNERIYEHGNYDEEIIWFYNSYTDRILKSNIVRKSIGFVESGFFSFRHDYGFLMIVLQDFKTRPSQMDQMHLDLWHKGINVFCDSGTYSYATDLGKSMALTEAHNTIKVDCKDQMRKHGPFLIYDWSSSKDIEFDENHFEGIMKSKNGYMHTRIVNKNSNVYTIIDEVESNSENYKVFFHTPCEIVKRENGVELFSKDKIIAKMIINNFFQIEECYNSIYYFKKEKINRISISVPSNDKSIVKIILINE